MEKILKKSKLLGLALITAFIVAACTPDSGTPGTDADTTPGTGNPTTTAAGNTTTADKPTIRVGTKDFTESRIVGELSAPALE